MCISLFGGIYEALEDITLVSGCRNLVLTSPHIASGETIAYVMQVVTERAISVGFCWLVQLTLNLSQDPLSQKMVVLLAPRSS